MNSKICVQQVLGSIMKKPQLLSHIDKYTLDLTDFDNLLERYVYVALTKLYESGATKIQPIDVEDCLSTNPKAEGVFQRSNGIEYLQDIYSLSEVDNFDYYYTKLKKINLLRDLSKNGFDISEIYIDDLSDPKAYEVNQLFETYTIQDIVNVVRRKLLSIESQYEVNDEVEIENVAEGLKSLLSDIQEQQSMGVPVQGAMWNQVINGAMPGTLTIRSAASGTGKTRNAIADACYLAFPMRFNWTTQKWEVKGSSEKVLFIVTEQQFSEARKMVLAYITGINEGKFRYANFSDLEREVLNQGIEILEHFKNNLILVKVPNPTIELIKTLVRENCLTHDITCVFYDYIFIGPALLGEFRGFALRNDEVLLMLSTALKDLAVELNVAMFTSTQLNAKGDDDRGVRNESSFAGSRAIINKADNGAIMARPTQEELNLFKDSKTGLPNLVTDVFKVRSGEWTQVKIWSQFDYATMRKTDLFITDAGLNPIENFYKYGVYEVKSWEDKDEQEYQSMVVDLNDRIKAQNEL